MKALEACLALMISQQQGTLDELDNPAYMFQRSSNVPTDTLMLSGRGPPAKKCGLIRCGFRPSDDACTLPFLIPANAMAVVELFKISQWLVPINKALADKCGALSRQVREAIEAFGIVKLPNGDHVYAYEVDGFGNYYLMDVSAPRVLDNSLTLVNICRMLIFRRS